MTAQRRRKLARTPGQPATDDAPGDVLFVLLNPAYVRNYEPVLRGLGSRGVDTTVAFEDRKERGDEDGLALMQHLCAEYESLHYELLAPPGRGIRIHIRLALEAIQDYLQYFEPPFDRASSLRARVVAFVPDRIERSSAVALRRAPAARRTLARLARRLALRMGPDPSIRRELERRHPGVLVVSPLVQFRSRQTDWILAARELGIGSFLFAYGWDQLTSKGRIHAAPDRIVLWNEAQRQQAIAFHDVEAASIRVTGAWPYEHWFAWTASRSRDELCAELGLPAERALILYVCSSAFIAGRERPAVAAWVRALRASDDQRVAGANVIVRPHPLNHEGWTGRPLTDLPGAAVFPQGGADPVDDASRSDYFDSMALSDVVVGVNTSALVESAIVDRPALAFPAPAFRATQEDLPHFQLLIAGGDTVKVSGSMADHVGQLSRALADPSASADARRAFVERFIRPPDRAASSTELVLSAIEELRAAAGSSRPDPASTMYASRPESWERL